MKTKLLVSLLLCLGLAAGCAKKTESSASSDTSSASSGATVQNGVKEVALSAGDNMKYDVTRIEVSPGQEVKVTLTNVGTLPKNAMGHNWILLKAGSDAHAFDTAGLSAQANGYFPTSLADEVIAHIPLLGPKESGSVTFKAPEAPGEYTYLCTFPGHFATGMHGVLVVK